MELVLLHKIYRHYNNQEVFIKKEKHQKGFSLPSVIVGSLIASVLGGIAITSMWGSVDNSKVTTIASVIKEQMTVFRSQPDFDYESLNTDANVQDYYADLLSAGILAPIPEVFEDPSALTWEIRRQIHDGYKNVYYSYIYSSNIKDKELINKAIEKLNINNNNIEITP